MHIFAKIKFLCNAIAGRVREPRRIVIPGLKEVQPLVADDLHHQVEAAAEVRGKMKPHVGLITKAVMPKDQPVVHSTKAVIMKDQHAVLMKEAAMVKDLSAVHLTKVAMA